MRGDWKKFLVNSLLHLMHGMHELISQVILLVFLHCNHIGIIIIHISHLVQKTKTIQFRWIDFKQYPGLESLYSIKIIRIAKSDVQIEIVASNLDFVDSIQAIAFYYFL
jgi:hypothetical protein